MRKITSLLMLFCMCVATAWAGPTDLPEITTDPSNPIYYTIYNTRSDSPGGLMYYAGDDVGLKDGCEYKGGALEAKYKFYFTGTHEALYIHNAAANGKKLASVNSWTVDGIEWAVGVSPKGTGLAFGPKGELNSNKCWNEQNQGRDGYTTWSANDDGSIFVCEKVENFVFPIKDGSLYVIECPLFYNKQGIQKGLYIKTEGEDNSMAWGTIDLTNKRFYWKASVMDGGKVAFQNLDTEQWFVGTGLGGIQKDPQESWGATFYALGSNQFKIVFKDKDGNDVIVHANGHGGGANNEGNIVSWSGPANSASAWTFTEKQDPDAIQELTVRYKFTHNSIVLKTQETKVLVGEDYPAFMTMPFGVTTLTGKPAEKVAEADATDRVIDKTIEIEINLPFTYAADYESIENWYYFKFHANNNYYLYHKADQDHIKLDRNEVVSAEKDAHCWAFVGNPFDGYQIVNKATGDGWVLSSSTTIDGDGANTWPIMTQTTELSGKNQIWIPTLSTHAENGFFLAQKDHPTHRMNGRNGKLAYWTGGADAGSTFVVEERDFTGATDLLKYIEEIECLVTEWKEAPGYLIPAKKDEVTAEINKAKEVATTKTGCFEEIERLKIYIAGVKTSDFTIQPNPNKFYKIVSSCTKDHRAGQNIYVNNTGGMQFAHPNDVATDFARVWQFVSAGDGKFYLKNVERGTFMNTAKSHGYGQETAVGTETEAKAVSIANMGYANIVSLTPAGGAMIHAQDNGSQVVAWNSEGTSDASAWKIEEVDINTINREVTVGAAGYSTLVLGYNAEIPEGVEAYVVSTTDNGWATLTPVTGVLPAGEAVVLKNEGSYNFNYSTETPATVETNLLEGTVFNTNFTEQGYVLSMVDEVVGFYKTKLNVSTDKTNDGTEEAPAVTYEAWLNNAFKAYLPGSVVTIPGVNALRFNFGGETTAIDAVEVENANAPIYDLSGRRVLSTVKGGIYIQNGKKFIVK